MTEGDAVGVIEQDIDADAELRLNHLRARMSTTKPCGNVRQYVTFVLVAKKCVEPFPSSVTPEQTTDAHEQGLARGYAAQTCDGCERRPGERFDVQLCFTVRVVELE